MKRYRASLRTLDPNALAKRNYAFDRTPNAVALFKVEVTGGKRASD